MILEIRKNMKKLHQREIFLPKVDKSNNKKTVIWRENITYVNGRVFIENMMKGKGSKKLCILLKIS